MKLWLDRRCTFFTPVHYQTKLGRKESLQGITFHSTLIQVESPSFLLSSVCRYFKITLGIPCKVFLLSWLGHVLAFIIPKHVNLSFKGTLVKNNFNLFCLQYTSLLPEHTAAFRSSGDQNSAMTHLVLDHMNSPGGWRCNMFYLNNDGETKSRMNVFSFSFFNWCAALVSLFKPTLHAMTTLPED